ncbi:Fic family protein [Bacteriovoracaceae bacterium]|nr:Fic family protein [Bacteriovoracaceae bacterium]
MNIPFRLKAIILFYFLIINFATADDRLLEIQADYLTAKSAYECLTGRSIHLIKDLIARRFINLPDWEKYKQENKIIYPECVYRPIPHTWEKWEQTAISSVFCAVDVKEQISSALLQGWHTECLSGKLKEGINTGTFKISDNYGANFFKSWALSTKEIKNINNFEFTFYLNQQNMDDLILESPLESKTSLKWTDLICYEDLNIVNNEISSDVNLLHNSQCHNLYMKSISNSGESKFWFSTLENLNKNDLFEDDKERWARWYWFACWPRANYSFENDSDKRCGMVKYPDSTKVKDLMSALANEVNFYFKSKHNTLTSELNPIKYAIRAQTMLAAIHPFEDGNGRISRYLMDYITLRSGLPTIYIPDMNNDYSAGMDQYYKWALESMEETISIIKKCTETYSTKPEYVNGPCGTI